MSEALRSISTPAMVWQYFNHELGLFQSADFVGVCHCLPSDHEARMEDVAVAIGYNAFIGRTCCMHVVIKRPDLFSRAILREAFEFPFLIVGCEAVLGLVDSTNEAALEFDKRIGFKEFARIPHGGPEGDLVLLRMMRSECRWITRH